MAYQGSVNWANMGTTERWKSECTHTDNFTQCIFFSSLRTRPDWFTHLAVFCSSSSFSSNMHWLSLLRNVNIITSPSCCQHSAAKRAKETSTLSNAIIRRNWSKLIRKQELVSPTCAPPSSCMEFLFISTAIAKFFFFLL